MADVMKHVWRYQEFRRTLFLNLSAKDSYGRHRGHVLYGMRAVPVGPRKLRIRPGAVYTPYGTKFYYDVVSPTTPDVSDIDFDVDVQIGGQSIFAAINNQHRPIVVALYARIVIDPSRSPKLEAETDIDNTTLKFTARVVTYSRATSAPTLDLEPLNPVTMDTAQPPPTDSFDYLKTWGEHGGFADRAPPGGDPKTSSLTVNEVLLGYVIVSSTAAGTLPANLEGNPGEFADGVEYVPARNVFEAITDVLGFDPLMGRVSKRIVGAPSGSYSALLQNVGAFIIGAGPTPTHPSLLSPKFGTPAPAASGDPWAVSWSTYRLPNFLRDGDPLIWAFRRMDYMLRLWMDRTGDQSLISLIQDGNGSNQELMSPLDKILRFFDGGVNAATNLNGITYPDNQPGSASQAFNHVLKSGRIGHGDLGTAVIGTEFADTHLSAIKVLDLLGWHVLQDVFGYGLTSGISGEAREGIERANLRSSSVWVRSAINGLKHFDDGPSGYLPGGSTAEVDRPDLVSGPVTSAYLGTDPLYDAIAKVGKRAVGRNLLRNPCFYGGDPNDQTEGAIPFWTVDGSAWTRNDLVPGLGLKYIEAQLDSGTRKIWQRLSLTGNTVLKELLSWNNQIGVSITLKNLGPGAAVVRVIGRDGALTKVFEVHSVAIGVTSEWSTHRFAFKLDTSALTLEHVDIEIASQDGVTNSLLQVAGVHLGSGVPDPEPAFTSSYHEFLTREGGENAAMRGNLVMGDQDIFFGTLYTDAVWNDRPHGDDTTAKPNYAGIFADPYVADDAGAKVALDELIRRSGVADGGNLLANGFFAEGFGEIINGDFATAPAFWAFGGGGSLATSTWAIVEQSADLGHVLDLLMQTDTYLEQVIGDAASSLLEELLADQKRLSVALSLKTDQQLTVTLTALDDLAADIGSATLQIGPNTEQETYTLSVQPSAGTIRQLRLRVHNVSGSAAAVDLQGVWLGFEAPPASMRSRTAIDFLSRGGGSQNAMRGPLDMGANRAVNLADPNDPQDAVTLNFLQSSPKLSSQDIIVDTSGEQQWPVPSGVSLLRVYTQGAGGGGGGGGGGNNSDGGDNEGGGAGGGGGSAGELICAQVAVAFGQTVEAIVGVGGNGGGGGGNGGTGGTGGSTYVAFGQTFAIEAASRTSPGSKPLDTFVLDSGLGDLTGQFSPGMWFRATGTVGASNDGFYRIRSVSWDGSNTIIRVQSRIKRVNTTQAAETGTIKRAMVAEGGRGGKGGTGGNIGFNGGIGGAGGDSIEPLGTGRGGDGGKGGGQTTGGPGAGQLGYRGMAGFSGQGIPGYGGDAGSGGDVSERGGGGGGGGAPGAAAILGTGGWLPAGGDGGMGGRDDAVPGENGEPGILGGGGGGGGGGGADNNPNNGQPGGKGGDGYVLLEW